MIITSQVNIENIRLYSYHGVFEQERKTGGWFLVSLTVDYPFVEAIKSDDVNDTLNYAELYEIVKQQMAIPSNLLENVAGRIIEKILSQYPKVEKVSVSLKKEKPPMMDDCSGASVYLCVTNDKTTAR